MILYFTGDLVDGLNSWGIPLVIYDLLKDILDTFNPIGMF